jgi:hypothetical protein
VPNGLLWLPASRSGSCLRLFFYALGSSTTTLRVALYHYSGSNAIRRMNLLRTCSYHSIFYDFTVICRHLLNPSPNSKLDTGLHYRVTAHLNTLWEYRSGKVREQEPRENQNLYQKRAFLRLRFLCFFSRNRKATGKYQNPFQNQRINT